MYNPMPRPTKQEPERGDARTRLLEAARDVIRRKGYTAATIDDLCNAAGVTKGAYAHHFESKEALGTACAEYWSETTSGEFESAAYQDYEDPLERVLGYVDFRRSIMSGDIADWTCLAGTMVQEVYQSYPSIRDACADSIFGHASTLEPDIAEAMVAQGIRDEWTAEGLAKHMQAVIQGAFILAKAADDPAVALESIDHLKRYIQLVFDSNP